MRVRIYSQDKAWQKNLELLRNASMIEFAPVLLFLSSAGAALSISNCYFLNITVLYCHGFVFPDKLEEFPNL